MKRSILILCIALLSLPLMAQETGYRIGEIHYTIDGTTRTRLLDRYMDFDHAKLFPDRESLDLYLKEKNQELINLRILAEGSVEISDIRKTESGDQLVDLEIYAKDTWNIVVLPYAKYDSNDGFLLSLRGRHYNFLGSMEELELNLDYWYTAEGENEFSLNGGGEIPFRIGSTDWNYKFDEELVYQEGQPINFDFENSFHYLISPLGIDLDFSWEQNFYLNDPYLDSEEIERHESYMESGAYLSGALSLPLELAGNSLSYSFRPGTSWAYTTEEELREDRKGLSVSYKHGLSFGRIDWIGNFRSGLKLDLDQKSVYNTFQDDWTVDLDGEMAYHAAWGWGGLNSRISGFTIFSKDDERDNVGGPLRGVLDDNIDDVNAGAYLNLDFPVKIWIWFMSRWFEGHLSPFFDAAIFRSTGGEVSRDTLWYSAGIEGFAFAKAARSLYLRVSFGFDLKQVIEEQANPWDVKELYIGLGHMY